MGRNSCSPLCGRFCHYVNNDAINIKYYEKRDRSPLFFVYLLVMGKKVYNFIDLFAGCGGLSEGFLQTGRFKSLAHIEWEEPMVDTLRHRLVQKWGHSEEEANNRVVLFDIQKTDELIYGNWSEESKLAYSNNSAVVQESGLKGIVGKKKVDIIIGGPPCQSYSIHGRATDKNSMEDDYRNYLFESFCKVVDAFSPEIFVFENVAGLLSAKPGGIPVRNRIFEAFDKIGYSIKSPDKLYEALFDAVYFNVPQHRPRVIIIGIKKNSRYSLDELYDAIKNESSSKHILTVRDAISDLPPLYPLEKPLQSGRRQHSHSQNPDATVFQHDARNHSPREIEIFKEWVLGNMNHITHKEMIDFYFAKTGHKTLFQKYKNLEWDIPSHTVVAHLSKDGYMFIHPDASQARSITIREAASLMTFPRDFIFYGSTPYNYRMIGNAVPVQFAKAIGKGLCKELDKK